jgi:hypothetical protein
MSVPYAKLPAWVDYGLIPLINLIVAFLVAGLVVLAVGESPLRAASLLIEGAFGYGEGIGFTLYYATNFIFTGLAVAVAFHCGLFNIGGEGQAYVAGLGVALPLPLARPVRALVHHLSRGHSRLRTCWRILGDDPWMAAGKARQPRGDHHHHVQLHRLEPDGLRPGRRAQAGRFDGAADPHFC